MKRKAPHNPVTPQMIADAQEAQYKLSEALHTIQKLEACGEDCQHYRAMIADWDKRLRDLVQHFGPNALHQQG